MDLMAMGDLSTPWCLRAVATLRIADHLAAGIISIDDLAAAAECDSEALRQVLQHMVIKGVFEEPEPGRFSLNEAAKGLLNPAQRIGLDLNGIGGRMTHAWPSLLSYLRTGAPAYHEVFGLPFWEDLEAHPEIAASFDALIGPLGHGLPNPNFDLAGGWERVRTVVDVGGGTGAMLAEILRIRPQVHGTLLDLPRTVGRSNEIFRSAGVTDRVTNIGQSFFDPLPAGADVYLLRGVLNNWPDPEAIELLRRCAEAARPQGRIVILKSVSDEGDKGEFPVSALFVGGKERTVAEFRVLADRAGLAVLAAERQPSGYFAVECAPVAVGAQSE